MLCKVTVKHGQRGSSVDYVFFQDVKENTEVDKDAPQSVRKLNALRRVEAAIRSELEMKKSGYKVVRVEEATSREAVQSALESSRPEAAEPTPKGVG